MSMLGTLERAWNVLEQASLERSMNPQNVSATHFLLTGTTTLCGLQSDAILLKATTPECEACAAIWQAAGWTFPLPAIAVVDG
jgi:hypothetical protein